MTTSQFYNLIGLSLFLLGFHAFFTRRRLLKKILSLNVAISGLFLVMISSAYAPAGGRPDPVFQALVLTGIVIAVSTTAFALVLAGRLGLPPDPGEDAGEPPAAER